MKHETKHFQDYFAPKAEVVSVSLEGVLCQSGEREDVTIGDMTVKDGASSGWGWE